MTARGKDLLQIVIPNNGVSPAPIFMHHAGGYTQFHATGGWVSPEGKSVVEPVFVVQIAATVEEFKAIMKDLRAAFPAEKEWFVANIGTAHLLPGQKPSPLAAVAS